MSGQDHKILLVDDQVFNIDAIVILLKYNIKINHDRVRVDKALSGQEALDLVKRDVEENLGLECGYTLILMDCNMPFMDGCTSTTEIRNLLFSY